MRCICCLVALLSLVPLAWAQDKVELGERFTDNMILSIGIPKNVEAQPANQGGGALGIWTNEKKGWVITVAQTMLDQDRPLEDKPGANGVETPGLLSATVAQLRSEGGDVVRNEIMPNHATVPGSADARRNRGDIALVMANVNVGLKPQFLQEALVRSSDRVYATVKMYSPPPVGDPSKDIALAEARATFIAMIDSIEVLDGAKVRAEQDARLMRTRQLMMQWSRQKLQAAMIPQQYLRIQHDGKDIGYCYVLNEVGNGLPQVVRDATTHQALRDPRTNELQRVDAKADPATADGLRVAIRTRTFPEKGKFVDIETWYYVTYDREHEIWKRLQVASDPQNPAKRLRSIWSSEIGATDQSIEKRFNRPSNPADMKKMEADLALFDESVRTNKPLTAEQQLSLRLPFQMVNVYRLTTRTENETAVASPVSRDLPPFYLPNALVEMLPRLVDLKNPTGYLFAVYNSNQRQVTMLYVDVKPTTDITFDGKRRTVVPVQMRHGMNAKPTIHYMSPDGKYVGTIDGESNATLIPSDESTLKSLWKEDIFNQPTEK